MNKDQQHTSPILEADGTVVAIAKSLLDKSTSYHLALKIFDKGIKNAFEIITFSGINLTELPLVAVGDKVSIQYALRPITAYADEKIHDVGTRNELLDIRIDWQSAYRNTFKYGDYS